MQTSSEEGLSREEVVAVYTIVQLISNQLPFDFSDYKISTLYSRIKRRIAIHDLSSIPQYAHLLKENPDEAKKLSEDFMIRVTRFFRDAEVYATMEKVVIPAIVTRAKNTPIKVWVAGCSSGEEAYSIGILFVEALKNVNLQVKIFATDIDTNALDCASKGVYPIETENDVSRERLERFFTREASGYKIKPEIRRMMIFGRHDLTQNPPYSKMDLVSCRNVLIYLNNIGQEKVFSSLIFGLKLDGYLLLGKSESPVSKMGAFKQVNRRDKIYICLKKEDNSANYFSTAVVLNGIKAPNEDGNMTGQNERSRVSDHLLTLIASQGNCAGVCITTNFDVIYDFGNLSKYLDARLFTSNLLNILPDLVKPEFKAAVQKAVDSMQRVTVANFNSSNNTGATLQICPFKAGEKVFILLLFQSGSPVQAAHGLCNENEDLKRHVVRLEHQVTELKKQLAGSVQELSSTNQDLQLFNEELLSNNEEMQSTNEEWQSVNEELQSVNQQYQQKIQQLTELNDDLNNYFRSNVSAQLIVDRDLRLKKFSPAATKHINVREIDIGRPIDDITTRIKGDTLVADIREVLDTGEVVTREVCGDEGSWYQLLIMPYTRELNNTCDGAIITLYDISKLKNIEKDLDYKNASLKRINAELDGFVYTASHDLIAPLSQLEGLIEMLKAKMQAGSTNLSNVTELVDTALARFKATIRDMSEIGKIEAEMLKEPDLIDIGSVIEDIQYSIHDIINATGAKITSAISIREIKFSKKNLRSIIYNLISNAIKFTPPVRKPDVHISTYKVPGFIVVMVKDNGIGMPDAQLVSMFHMYKQHQKHLGGQGLGLYLVKKITDSAGGKIEVESLEGEGTIFRIFLPSDAHLL